MTFLLGLLVTGAASVFVGKRLLQKDFDKASKTFVEKSTMDAAVNSWTDFENNTKTHVKALKAQVDSLTLQVAAMKTANDSLGALTQKLPDAGKKAAPATEVAKKSSGKRRR